MADKEEDKIIECDVCGIKHKRSILDKYDWLEQGICYCEIINKFEDLKKDLDDKLNYYKDLNKEFLDKCRVFERENQQLKKKIKALNKGDDND